MIDSRGQTKITSSGSATNPKPVPGLSGDPRAPALSSRPWFFSLLPSADVKRTEISLNAAQRRVTGFIRFITGRPLSAKDVKTAADASQELLTAAKEGTVETVKKHINSAADINRVDERGMSAIMYAAQCGNFDMIKALVAAGSRINMVNEDGKDALMLAAENGNAGIVDYLIAWGAGFTRADRTGYTALVLAARAGKTAVIQSFINVGVDIDAPVDNGSTPLMFAAENGHVEFVKELIAKGADVNKNNIKHGKTAMMCAAKKGQTAVVRLLLSENASVDARNAECLSSMELAACHGHAAVVELLVPKNSSVDAQNAACSAALKQAAGYGEAAVVELLLSKITSVDAQNAACSAALKQAAGYGEAAVVELLLSKITSVDAQNAACSAALRVAAGYGQTAIVELLLSKITSVDAQNAACLAALRVAARFGQTTVVELLLAKKISANAKDVKGRTALMLAARHGQTAVVELLLKHRASGDEETMRGRNALIFAAERGHYATVTSLIEGGANQYKALLTLLKYNRPQITKVIVRAWLNSKKNKFDALTAINCCAHQAVTGFPTGSRISLSTLDALAEGGLTLTTESLATLKAAVNLAPDIEHYMKKLFVDGHISREGKIGNAYFSGNHAVVDDLIDAPYKTLFNPLGLVPHAATEEFDPDTRVFKPEHTTLDNGEYLHAVGTLRDKPTNIYSSWERDSMLSRGWRSKITTLVRNARNDATEATRQISSLLADRNQGFTLINEIGSLVPPTDIRLKDTLFAFELERNEGLHQIIEPPGASLFDKFMAWGKGKHEQASKAQAEAILASNSTYIRLKLNMPALAKAKSIEKRVRTDGLTKAAAVAELDRLMSETEQTYREAPAITSELAYHWFISEVGKMYETLETMRDQFKEASPAVPATRDTNS